MSRIPNMAWNTTFKFDLLKATKEHNSIRNPNGADLQTIRIHTRTFRIQKTSELPMWRCEKRFKGLFNLNMNKANKRLTTGGPWINNNSRIFYDICWSIFIRHLGDFMHGYRYTPVFDYRWRPPSCPWLRPCPPLSGSSAPGPTWS